MIPDSLRNTTTAATLFEGVSYSYDGKTLALDDLSLTVPSGEFLCILGGNGSGKSTLAQCINGLLIPSEGTVETAGLPTDDPKNTFEVRASAGMVFQNPDDQIVATIIEDDVAFGPENLGVSSEELRQRVTRSLERVGLRGFEKRETSALSGGQKQRVAIAGVLAMEPRILILDEASAMLDPRGRRELLRLCRELNEEGLTIVLITHFMEEAALAKRIVVLKEGAIALDGPPKTVLAQARELQGLSLDVPFSVRTALALEDAGVSVPITIDESRLTERLQGLLGKGNPPSNPVEIPPMEAKETDKALIEFQDVSFSYLPKRALKRAQENSEPFSDWGGSPYDPWALRHGSFTVHQGDFLGIAGHTGSGKSTLLQLADGLLQPTEGRILLNGQDLSDKAVLNDGRKTIGLVFQYPEHQLFAPTVFEDVAFGPKNLGLDGTEIKRRVDKALESVHLDPDVLGEKSPFALSGGQQRRVALAGILAMEPSVLILDEPAVGLDPQGRQRLLELITELHEKQGMTVIMASHSMDDLGLLCNRLLVLNRGTIVREGSPRSVFADGGEMRSLGLGIPRTLALAEALGLQDSFPAIPTIPELAQVIAASLPGDPGASIG